MSAMSLAFQSGSCPHAEDSKVVDCSLVLSAVVEVGAYVPLRIRYDGPEGSSFDNHRHYRITLTNSSSQIRTIRDVQGAMDLHARITRGHPSAVATRTRYVPRWVLDYRSMAERHYTNRYIHRQASEPSTIVCPDRRRRSRWEAHLCCPWRFLFLGVGTDGDRLDEAIDPCYRTSYSYGYLLFWERTADSSQLINGACGGARTRHMLTDGQFSSHQLTPSPSVPQLDYLTADVDLVTLTIGGNDVGFSAVIAYCAVTEACQRSLWLLRVGPIHSPRTSTHYTAPSLQFIGESKRNFQPPRPYSYWDIRTCSQTGTSDQAAPSIGP